jgi:integrase
MVVTDADEAKHTETARVTGAYTVMDIVRTWWLGPVIEGEHRGGHRQRVSGVTQRNYQYYIDAYISRIGAESAQSYARNPGLLKLFYDSLPNRCAWHVHGVLRMALREALARGLIDRNPCMETKPARRKRIRRIVPSRAEVDKLVAAAEERSDRWGVFVYLTSVLGTRCGETVALRSEDFDEAAGIVRIERAVSKTPVRPTIKEPKKGEPRELPIEDPAFWEHVRRFLGAPGFLFPGFYRDGPRTEEKPWHPDHAERKFRKMVHALGLPQYTLHSVRHFVATQLLIEGQPINQVAEFLGHTPQMTLMLYGRHLDREAMRRVGRAATGLVKRSPAPAPAPAGDDPGPPRLRAPAPVVAQHDADEAVLALGRRAAVTNARVQREAGLTRRQASKALARLVGAGLLERRGEKKGTHYEMAGK